MADDEPDAIPPTGAEKGSEKGRNRAGDPRLNPTVKPAEELSHAAPMAGSSEDLTVDAEEVDVGAELMARIRDGELEAFSELVERYQRSVQNAVYKYSGNRAIAEELAQEVFVRVFRARLTYERKARFETWLYRIVFNLCANASAYAKRRRAVSLDQSAGDDTSSTGSSPGRALGDPKAGTPLDALENMEIQERVREAILRLPGQQRAALILSRYENKPYQEVSQALGTSVEAVKSLLFRARENLRQALLPYIREDVIDET